MTKLYDIMDVNQLEDEIEAGYVVRRFHPEFPELAILNYADACQFERHWTPITRMTRGLIYNTDTFDVLARPFAKIHNWDERDAPNIAWDQIMYHVGDKYDGSLGIFYQRPDGKFAIATRGSFDSEQARHATELLNAWDNSTLIEALEWWGYGDLTPLFEIIYPENRIVVNYGDLDTLFMLGIVRISDGSFIPDAPYPKRKFSELMQDLSRPNAEGWVAWLTPWKAVKIKQADYIELHRIVSNLTPKEIWRQLRAGTFGKYIESLPDEFYEWASKEAQALALVHQTAMRQIHVLYSRLMLQELPSRREQALWVQKNVPKHYQGLVFALLDGKDISDRVWAMVEPKGSVTREEA